MEIFLTRSLADLNVSNMLTLGILKVRFQLAPGAGDDLGIANADYTIAFEGEDEPRHQGKTNAAGEVPVPVLDLVAGMLGSAPLVIEILGTRYALRLHPGLESMKSFKGLQKRLDALGYMTGYQLEPLGNAKPDDGLDGPRTQQAIRGGSSPPPISSPSAAAPRFRNHTWSFLSSTYRPVTCCMLQRFGRRFGQ